jgi:hypothetical protein
MTENKTAKWPAGFGFSMSPFGYTTSVNKVIDHDLSVEYRCALCSYQVGFDAETGTLESAKSIFRKHVDEAH